jgi:hypothetical protein
MFLYRYFCLYFFRNEEAQNSTISVKRELDESDSEETIKKLRLQENEAIIEDSK